MPTTLSYIFVILYCIFTKQIKPKDVLKKELTEISGENLYTTWIVFEVHIFEGWIASSIIFMLYTYYFKFMGIWKKNEEKMNLDKIWDMKNSRDLLHYLKFEVDNFNLSTSMIFTNVIMIVKYNEKENDINFGKDHYYLSNAVRLLMTIASIVHFSRPYDDVCGIDWKKIWVPFLILLVSMFVTLVAIVKKEDLF